MIKDDFLLLADLVVSAYRQRYNRPKQETVFWTYRPKRQISLKLRRQACDSLVVAEVWWLNKYLRHFPELKKHQKLTILDIGAHLGSFSVLAGSLYLDAQIYSFEPHPDNFGLLKENLSRNNLHQKASPFNFAVTGRSQKDARLIPCTKNSGMHRLLIARQLSEGIAVKTITLEEIFLRNKLEKCDFLKMDCEGTEEEILLHTPLSILARIKKMVFEYHRGVMIEKIETRLQEAGFVTKRVQAFPWRPVRRFVNVPLLVCWREED
ncbi:FkbM family methyltransferase [Patescibacteria group bacterium]|nr:FkbM family methyltransferase [Patescibacteria group bacterium]